MTREDSRTTVTHHRSTPSDPRRQTHNSRYRTSSGKLRVGSSRVRWAEFCTTGVQEVPRSFASFIAATAMARRAWYREGLAASTPEGGIVQDPPDAPIATRRGRAGGGHSDALARRVPLLTIGSHAVATFVRSGYRPLVREARLSARSAFSILAKTATGVDLFKLEQATTVPRLGFSLHDRNVAEAEVASVGTSRPSCSRLDADRVRPR